MSTAHTPTPWEHTPMADGRHHVLGILCTEYRGNETAPYHPLVASVFHGRGHAPREIAEANAAFIVRACNSHAANEAYKQSLFTLLDALYVSPDLPMADVLAKLARLEARNAKRAQDNAALVAALEYMLSADRAICENIGLKSDQAMNRIAALDQARAALAAAKE